ncbi:MAG: hypothetical protein ACRDHP_06770 [Ktedonobacterales bacterium]
MVIAVSEPGWLHVAGQAAGAILLLELGVALFIILALMAVLAAAVWWVKGKVVPIVREYAPRAEQIMTTTQHGTDRVVQGVAEFYGRRQQIETGIRVLLFGRAAAQRVRETALVQATTDLELMAPAQEGPGPENGWTPQMRQRGREVYSGADVPSVPRAIEPAQRDGAGAANGNGPILWRPRQEDGSRRESDDDSTGFGRVAGSAG